jgi:hypothetical protein
MDTNGSGTDFSALSRLGAVDSGACDDLADVFLGSTPSRESVEPESDPIESDWAQAVETSQTRVLQLVVGAHLNDADDLFLRLCESQSVDPERAVGCIHYGASGWSARLIGSTHRFNGDRVSVSQAISQVSAVSDRVNVLLPSHNEVGELIEGLDDLADPPDAIIVLTTEVESDVVAAYRQLKSIASFCPAQLARTEVVMVATQGEEAQAAMARLLDTATRFLDASIAGRIIPESGSKYTPEIEESVTEPDVIGPEEVEPEVVDQPEPIDSPEPISKTAATESEPTPVPPPAFADPHDDDEHTLLACLTLGMEILDLRCPDAPRVLLAADASGRIHAFASMIEAEGLEPEPSPLAALTQARAFITRHMPMLAPLEPRVQAGAGLPLTHLVSDHFAHLEPCLGTEIHLHLAVPVRVAGRTIWGVSELSTD